MSSSNVSNYEYELINHELDNVTVNSTEEDNKTPPSSRQGDEDYDDRFVNNKLYPIQTPVLSSSLHALYEIVECISRSYPSSIYILKSKEDNTSYAMKMTECLDESEAIKAYHEAMELRKLDHRNVCAYKEFFITYDKQSSAMFVNIVTQFFPAGNLRTLIRRYQSRKEVMHEKMVKTILGEIMEGLVYIHKCGFVHRNIKPSNVFRGQRGAMVLGDLGVSTLMGDLRTNTRQTFYGTVFMAPEIGQQPHDEKSDLYSVGGVILNMLTTSFLPEYEFYQKLGEIKECPEILNEYLQLVSDKYSKAMVNTVQALLWHKHSLRPQILEFIKSGFVQECMAQVNSSQMDTTVQQKEKKSSKIYSLGEHRGDVHQVLEYIADTIHHESYIAEGLSALADILRDNDRAHEAVDQKARNLISLAMWDNTFNRDIQIAGCYVLSNLAVFSKPDDILFTPDIIAIVHKIISSHEYDPEVQLAAVDLVLALSADERASRLIVQLGGIHHILTAMRHARYHATLTAVCCMALWSLSVDSENLKVACKENAVRDVCIALNTHKVSPDVCEAVAAALVSLLLDDSCYDVFNELDCPGNLVAAIHLHKKNIKVVTNCCKVLAIVVQASEESAYQFLSSNKEDSGTPTGISTVMEAYRVHKDNASVVESIVRLLLELSNYDEICLDLKAENVTSYLKKMSQKFKDNQEIMSPVREALDRLGAGSYQPSIKSS